MARGKQDNVNGFVYIIHMDKPYKHCRHYVGFTQDIVNRMEQHRNVKGWNLGSPLLDACNKAGIGYEVVAMFPGTRELERRIKGGHSKRFCPICSGKNKDPKNFRKKKAYAKRKK